jgi:AcrR family transcriptional regulator
MTIREANRLKTVRRKSILDAAARLFRTKGYHATTMAEIGAAVGMLGGSLYYHVESKEALLYAIVEASTRGLLTTVHEIASAPAPAPERLRQAILSHLRFSLDPGRSDYAVIFLNEIQNLRDRHMRGALLQLVKHYEELFARIVRDGVAAGHFRPDLDVKTVVFAILGMENWALRWLRPDGRLSVEEVATQFADLVIRGLAHQPPARDGGRA